MVGSVQSFEFIHIGLRYPVQCQNHVLKEVGRKPFQSGGPRRATPGYLTVKLFLKNL